MNESGSGDSLPCLSCEAVGSLETTGRTAQAIEDLLELEAPGGVDGQPIRKQCLARRCDLVESPTLTDSAAGIPFP